MRTAVVAGVAFLAGALVGGGIAQIRTGLDASIEATAGALRADMQYFRWAAEGRFDAIREAIRRDFNAKYCGARYLDSLPGIGGGEEAVRALDEADQFRRDTLQQVRPYTDAELACERRPDPTTGPES
jgi:hypothetical protein